MKIKHYILPFILLTPALVACEKAPEGDFVMPVKEIFEMKGFIMHGVYVAGTITKGCIATDDKLEVKRGKQTIAEETAKILGVSSKPGEEVFEAQQGDYLKLYLPDRKQSEFEIGDVVISNAISCKPAATDTEKK